MSNDLPDNHCSTDNNVVCKRQTGSGDRETQKGSSDRHFVYKWLLEVQAEVAKNDSEVLQKIEFAF